MLDGIYNDIPSSLRTPGWYIEFDNRLAGNATIMRKILVVGQRLTDGSKTEGSVDRVTNGEQAEEYYGRGSMLAEMLKAMKDIDPYMETWGLPLDDDAAGVAATGKISITGPATAAGTLTLYIAGYRVRVGVGASDSADAIATAVAAAINADTTLPVTAEVDSTTTSQVNLTCRWKGETGNDIDLRLNYYGEKLPAGVTVTFTAMSGGTANPDMATAIAAMGDEWWNWIVLPYTDTANLVAVEDELDERWGPMQHIGARAFTAFRGNHSATGTFGSVRNGVHVTCMGTNLMPTPPYLFAATNAIVAGPALAEDPARPLQRLRLPGVLPPKVDERWTQAERNLLLFDGISTYTVGDDGSVYIERQITMYQENAAGIADDSYLDINTPETLSRIRYEQRAMFAQKYPRHKLAEDADRPRFGPAQPIMFPSLARSELLALYEDVFIARGWCQDYEGYKASLQAGIADNDPSRLNVLDSPKLVGQYRVHAQQTQFRR